MNADKGFSIPIPAVSFEMLDWRVSEPELFSRAERIRQTGQYQAAIPAEIAEYDPAVPGELMSDIEDATMQIVELSRHAQLMLGIESTVLGPMSAILLRTESSSSSQIERLTTSAKQLALAELQESAAANANVVVGNVRAMETALKLASELSENSILAMHRALMEYPASISESQVGSYRNEQVWIGKGSAGPRAADFVPPHRSRVERAMKDLVQFLNRQDLPVLLQAAISHGQFETIHPFTDGNGRTGRALVQSLLKNKGLIASTAVPISSGLLTDVEKYFQALTEYRSGDAGPLVSVFAQSTRLAAVRGKQLIDQLAAELDDAKRRLAGLRADATAWKILPLLISQPVISSRYLVSQMGIGEMAALRALNQLEELGVLKELTGWRRMRVWQHSGVLRLLDDYAATLKRNSRD